jgi:hypothetical protein
MSSAFDINPVPAFAEGLDITLSPDATESKNKGGRKFFCEEGTYDAIVTKMEPYVKEGKPTKIRFEVTLVEDGVKDIKATRFFDTTGSFAWTLVAAVKAFGVVPVKGPDGTETLPLKQNFHKIVGAECKAEVKPRKYVNNNGEERTSMDLQKLFPATKKEDSSIPF